MQETRSIVWVRSVLAVYRQAAVEAARDDIDAAQRRRVLDELARIHGLFAAHEDIDVLWRQGFGGSEERARAAFRPLIEAALAGDAGSPMRALAEFAAEEIAFLFEDETATDAG